MKKTVKILLIGAGTVALALVAARISTTARKGELGVHLNHELVDVRRESGLLPLKPHPGLAGVCADQAKAMAGEATVRREAGGIPPATRLRDAGISSSRFYMEVGRLPASRLYRKASPELIAAARNAGITHRGFGRYESDKHQVFYCYLVAAL